jgi:hypothetical protein
MTTPVAYSGCTKIGSATKRVIRSSGINFQSAEDRRRIAGARIAALLIARKAIA